MFFIITLKFLFVVIYIIDLMAGLISVNDTENNTTVERIYDAEFMFGGRFKEGEMAYVIESNPPLACNKTIEPPPYISRNGSDIIFVALIKRGMCTFEDKIRVAQNSGYKGVIIYNNESDYFFSIKVHTRDIHIPARMVGLTSGRSLKEYSFTKYPKQYIVIFTGESEFNPLYYIIAFLGFVSLGFIIIGVGFVIKICRDCIKRRANRLKKCHLKKIPVKKFVKGEDTYDTCAICLDDFDDGDRLRILPCNHAYHMKCIDPWLLKQKRNCPVCKCRVKIPGREEDSDDNSSVVTQSETVHVVINEHTPLINAHEATGSQSYLSNTDSDVNFVPNNTRTSNQNSYENRCVDIDEHSIDVIVVGMSINNDVSDMCVVPSSVAVDGVSPSRANTRATEDLINIV